MIDLKYIEDYNIVRHINKVVWHCTASPQTTTAQQIIDYHIKTLKWSKAGYHIIVSPDGNITLPVDFNIPSNGVRNMNSNIINICYIGGVDRNLKALDNRTPEQLRTMEALYFLFKRKIPKASHHGHYEFTNKDCPSFNVPNWIKEIETKNNIN